MLRRLFSFLFGRHLSVIDGALIGVTTYLSISESPLFAVSVLAVAIIVVATIDGLFFRRKR
ncbi:MAG: hypothetical protein RIS35_1860 [Pseudomonadota bacterium]|jgi:hypothetical protein